MGGCRWGRLHEVQPDDVASAASTKGPQQILTRRRRRDIGNRRRERPERCTPAKWPPDPLPLPYPKHQPYTPRAHHHCFFHQGECSKLAGLPPPTPTPIRRHRNQPRSHISMRHLRRVHHEQPSWSYPVFPMRRMDTLHYTLLWGQT